MKDTVHWNEDFSQLLVFSSFFKDPKKRSAHYKTMLTKLTTGKKLAKLPLSKLPVLMPNSTYCLSFFLFSFFYFFSVGFTVKAETAGTGLSRTKDSTRLVYNAGVVLDVDSKMGAMANICSSMALSDFYAEHPDYGTRLSLQRLDLLEGVTAASSEHLTQQSVEASFAIKLGESSSPPYGSCIISAALADFSRLAKATVSILEKFERDEVILIYEDMGYGHAIVPYLTDALENMDIQLSHEIAIPTSAQDFQILEELEVLMTLQSKVFVVHMTTTLASRLFLVANKAGMMTKGFAWLVTDGLSNFVDTMDLVALDSMKGTVIGIRPCVPKTKALKDFKKKYKRLSLVKQNNVASELNLFGLWVYDTIWALAMSVERIGTVNSGFLNEAKGRSSADAQISELGPRRILEEISSMSFQGISGDFDLVNGQLQPLVFEVFNLTAKGEKMLSYWTPDQGISRNLSSARTSYSTSRNKLKEIITPADTRRTLKTNDMPAVGEKWKIGVPGKTVFKEFVNIHPGDKKGDDDKLPGFSIEVFKAVWETLALPSTTDYEFVTFDVSYDDLCCKVKDKIIDAAVGDISIVASRINCVDFTLPYLQSGVTMLIKVSHHGPEDMWIFLKPLSWDLWLTIISICVFIGIVVWVLERRENTDVNGSPQKLLSKICTLPFLSVAIPQRDMVVTNCSRLVLVIWIFLAFILMQSYTANLSSILTINQLQPTITTIKELRTRYVGYQNRSFVRDFLINQLGFNESMLRPYDSVDNYEEALSKGSDNGGVAAIFDEIPDIKLFLAEYTTGYMMAGPAYRNDGLGFAFPVGSPLVANFSRAILNFTQGKYMSSLEKKYFGKISIDQDEVGPVSSSSPSLTSRSFAGLFIITGIVVLLALVVSENHILGRLVRKYIIRDSHDVSRSGSRLQPTAEMSPVASNPPEINDIEECNEELHPNIDPW
ncbi:glutamate receptor 2.8-like [Durio zibethinus]|uniref:Glutamate receptor n=1 Tax=Durio zibethinus TaxID=66656 RepID=A0A6P5ZP97_DURZI|nr:glutamate receptor 2.8-like [Durio zibethinus]